MGTFSVSQVYIRCTGKAGPIGVWAAVPIHLFTSPATHSHAPSFPERVCRPGREGGGMPGFIFGGGDCMFIHLSYHLYIRTEPMPGVLSGCLSGPVRFLPFVWWCWPVRWSLPLVCPPAWCRWSAGPRVSGVPALPGAAGTGCPAAMPGQPPERPEPLEWCRFLLVYIISKE